MSRIIAIERKRIDNVYIDGIQIKEITIPEKLNLFQIRPKRNIKIDKNKNTEEIEETNEGPKVDPGNSLAWDESSSEDDKEQQWQQVERKRGKAPIEKGKMVSFTITNNGNDNRNDISHHIFHSDGENNLETRPRMVFEAVEDEVEEVVTLSDERERGY